MYTQMQNKPLRVIGVDPGYERLGIAVLEKNSLKKTGEAKLIFSECFQTSSKLPFPERLRSLGEEIRRVINDFEPDRLAIETLFINTNQKTAMHVAEARGVIIYEAKINNLSVSEHSPLFIKTAITSYGRADKKQMISMINKLVKIDRDIKHDDEYDAIAVALTEISVFR